MPRSHAEPAALDLLRDAEWLRIRYVDQRASRRDIAAQLGVAPSTVGEWLSRHGIEARDSGKARAAVAAAVRPEELNDIDWLRERYYAEGMSLEGIAEKVGVAPSTVRAALDRHGLRTRTDLLRDKTWIAFQVGATSAPEVAEAIGTTASTVYRWMRRHGLPSSGVSATVPDMTITVAGQRIAITFDGPSSTRQDLDADPPGWFAAALANDTVITGDTAIAARDRADTDPFASRLFDLLTTALGALAPT